MKTKLNRIPKFESYLDEAQFWDTHSPEDFPEQFKPTKVKFRHPLRIRLAVPLEESSVKELERIGRERGVEPVELARKWILERLGPIQS